MEALFKELINIDQDDLNSSNLSLGTPFFGEDTLISDSQFIEYTNENQQCQSQHNLKKSICLMNQIPRSDNQAQLIQNEKLFKMELVDISKSTNSCQDLFIHQSSFLNSFSEYQNQDLVHNNAMSTDKHITSYSFSMSDEEWSKNDCNTTKRAPNIDEISENQKQVDKNYFGNMSQLSIHQSKESQLQLTISINKSNQFQDLESSKNTFKQKNKKQNIGRQFDKDEGLNDCSVKTAKICKSNLKNLIKKGIIEENLRRGSELFWKTIIIHENQNPQILKPKRHQTKPVSFWLGEKVIYRKGRVVGQIRQKMFAEVLFSDPLDRQSISWSHLQQKKRQKLSGTLVLRKSSKINFEKCCVKGKLIKLRVKQSKNCFHLEKKKLLIYQKDGTSKSCLTIQWERQKLALIENRSKNEAVIQITIMF